MQDRSKHDQQFMTILQAVLAKPAGERETYLQDACDGDQTLLLEVREALSWELRMGGFLQKPVIELHGDDRSGPIDATANDIASAEETLIGPYQLVRKLGEGGMGVVYHARQSLPIRRDVALKLVRPGMDSRQVLARFEGERQALAIMDHPGIARVFDAGTTPSGRPYFVMGLVNGVPITSYCEDRQLSIRERLKLFVEVCKAIHHAHQKGIIHRDIKPSNILVEEREGGPQPLVIDFGIAKATGPHLTGATMYTQTGLLVGTLEYMSPEQAYPGSQDVDTRSDIYALGIVLYELLTGSTPLGRESRDWSLETILRAIREQDPIPPGHRKNALSGADREVDWIVLKALEKNRDRRYQSANGLARDIERYLAGESIEAAPPSAAYRTHKFIRRHLVSVSFAGMVGLFLIILAVAATFQARRTGRERDRANRVTQFMVGVFNVADPLSNDRGNTITAREILDKSAKEIESGLNQEPEVKADLLGTMAQSYNGLGLYSSARDLATRALDIQRRTRGPNDPKTLETMSFIGSAMVSMHDNVAGAKWLKDTLTLQRKALGPDDPITLRTQHFLSDAYFGMTDLADSERIARDTVERDRRMLGPENKETLKTMARLAAALELQGHYTEAEKVIRDVVAIERRTIGPEAPETLNETVLLTEVLIKEEHFSEAETLLADVLPKERRILGPEHIYTLEALSDLAYAHLKEGKYSEAEKLFREIVEIRQRQYGADSTHLLTEMQELAITYARENNYPEASRLFGRAINIADKAHDPVIGIVWYNFACAAAIAGHRDEAFRYLRQAVEKGWAYADEISADKDLISLHKDSRFAATVNEARRRAATSK